MWTPFTAAARKASEATPMIEPIERSNSPEIIRRVTPMATIPGTAWLVRIEEIELFDKKVSGTEIEKKAKMARNPTKAPASGCWASRLRQRDRKFNGPPL